MQKLLKSEAIVANPFVTYQCHLVLPNLHCFSCYSCMLAWLSTAWAVSVPCYWFCLYSWLREWQQQEWGVLGHRPQRRTASNTFICQFSYCI